MAANSKSVDESQNLKQFVKENASSIFGLDRRIVTTLRLLLFRPGQLTSSFVKGDIHAYTPPTTFYFTINLVFFLLLPIVNSGSIKIFGFSYEGFTKTDGMVKEWVLEDQEESGLTEEVYKATFNSFIKYNQPALVFVIVPFLVLILRIANLKYKRALLTHTVYAFHFMSFFLISFLILGSTVNFIALTLQYFKSESLISFLLTTPLFLYAIWIFYYLFKSIKVVYQNTFLSNLIKSLTILISMVGLLFIYTRFLLALCIFSVN